MPLPEPAGPTTELDLAGREQVPLGIQLLTVLDAEPSCWFASKPSHEAYLGRVFILIFASPPVSAEKRTSWGVADGPHADSGCIGTSDR